MLKKASIRYGWRILVGVVGGVLLAVAITMYGRRNTYNGSELRATSVGYDNCVELQVALDKRTYTQGEPITVTATTLVLDDARASVARNRRSSMNFELDIVDDRDKTVPLTEEGFAILNIKPAFVDTTVSRDRPFQESFRIDTWFELSEPGMYTLTVRQIVRVLGTDEAIEVIGNPVTFTRLP